MNYKNIIVTIYIFQAIIHAAPVPEVGYNDPEIDVSERSVRQVKSADVARKSFQAQAAEDHTVTDSEGLKGIEDSQPEHTKKTVSFSDQNEAFEFPGKKDSTNVSAGQDELVKDSAQKDSGRSNKKSWSQSAYDSFVSFFKSIGINFSKMIQAWSKMTDTQINKLESDLKYMQDTKSTSPESKNLNAQIDKAITDLKDLQSKKNVAKDQSEPNKFDIQIVKVVNDLAEIMSNNFQNVNASIIFNDLSQDMQIQLKQFMEEKRIEQGKQHSVYKMHDTIQKYRDNNWTIEDLNNYINSNFTPEEQSKIKSGIQKVSYSDIRVPYALHQFKTEGWTIEQLNNYMKTGNFTPEEKQQIQKQAQSFFDTRVQNAVNKFDQEGWTMQSLNNFMDSEKFNAEEKEKVQEGIKSRASTNPINNVRLNLKPTQVSPRPVYDDAPEQTNLNNPQRSSSDNALVNASATHEEFNLAQPDTALIHASSSNVELNAPQPDIQQRSNTQNSFLADIQKGQSVLKPSVQRKVVQPQALTFEQQLQQSTKTTKLDTSLDNLTEEEEEEKKFKDDELGAVSSQVQQGVNSQATSTQNQQAPVNTASAILNSPQSRKMLDVVQSRYEQPELKNNKDEEDEWS